MPRWSIPNGQWPMGSLSENHSLCSKILLPTPLTPITHTFPFPRFAGKASQGGQGVRKDVFAKTPGKKILNLGQTDPPPFSALCLGAFFRGGGVFLPGRGRVNQAVLMRTEAPFHEIGFLIGCCSSQAQCFVPSLVWTQRINNDNF